MNGAAQIQQHKTTSRMKQRSLQATNTSCPCQCPASKKKKDWGRKKYWSYFDSRVMSCVNVERGDYQFTKFLPFKVQKDVIEHISSMLLIVIIWKMGILRFNRLIVQGALILTLIERTVSVISHFFNLAAWIHKCELDEVQQLLFVAFPHRDPRRKERAIRKRERANDIRLVP